MAEKLKTTLLECDKSTFIIDLIKHTNGQLYIEVEQIIHLANDTNEAQKIKIRRCRVLSPATEAWGF